MGAKSELRVWSEGMTLSEVGLVDQSIHVDLRLPTGEILRAWVDDQREGSLIGLWLV